MNSVRLAQSLAYLDSFRHATPPVQAEVPPITPEAVQAWRDEHPFLRAHLTPAVATSLAYLATFKPKSSR